jgi:hypothetical protein
MKRALHWRSFWFQTDSHAPSDDLKRRKMTPQTYAKLTLAGFGYLKEKRKSAKYLTPKAFDGGRTRART